MASTSTAVDAPQPADPSKAAAPQAEVADTDVEMQDADKDASDPSSSDSKHRGDMTGTDTAVSTRNRFFLCGPHNCVDVIIPCMLCLQHVMSYTALSIGCNLQANMSFVAS